MSLRYLGVSFHLLPPGDLHVRICYLHDYVGNQGSVVIIKTRLQAGRSGVYIPVGERYFSVLQNVQSSNVAHLASYPIDSFPGIKQPKHEVNTCTSI
jgi:hypothetical protein